MTLDQGNDCPRFANRTATDVMNDHSDSAKELRMPPVAIESLV